MKRYVGRWPARVAIAGVTVAIAAGCSSSGDSSGAESPFASFEPAANAPETFTTPRSAVPLSDGSIVFIARHVKTATRDETDLSSSMSDRTAVFHQAKEGGAPTVIYAGDKFSLPFDIAVSVDEKTIYIADVSGGAEGRGTIFTMPVTGGDPAEVASGYMPAGVSVGPDGKVYFTGHDKMTGQPGVFQLNGNDASGVAIGAPFVDPSGIAVAKDGRIFVADTSLGDDVDLHLDSRSGVVLVQGGKASVFASGFDSGYPAGIALTMNDASLILSAQMSSNRSDAVYVFTVGDPAKDPVVTQDKIKDFRDSAAGLKRAHGSDTFAWASLSGNGGGTVYAIKAK